jgi:regulator of sigma E protease
MAQDEENDDPSLLTDPKSFANKPAWRRFLVISAGPAANYLLSFLLGIGLLMTAQQEAVMKPATIGGVDSSGPAAKGGLQSGDEIRAVDGMPVADWNSMRAAINAAAKAHPDAPVPFTIFRGGHEQSLQIQPADGGGGAYIIKVEPGVKWLPGLPIFQAIPQSAIQLYERTADDLSTYWSIITRKSTPALSGPPGIIKMVAEKAKKGLYETVNVAWMLSIAVGFFNLLPIPGLDGGRLIFLTYEIIARRRVNQKVENWIHFGGIACLILLIAFVSYGDLVR